MARAFPEYAVTIVNLPPSIHHLQQVMSVAGPDIIVVSRSEAASTLLQVSGKVRVRSSLWLYSQTIRSEIVILVYIYRVSD